MMRMQALANSLESAPAARPWLAIANTAEPVAALTRVSPAAETKQERSTLRILAHGRAQEVASFALRTLHTAEGGGQASTA